VTNAAGLTTVQAYDTAGRLVSVSQTATGETSRQTQYYYDAAGNLSMVQDAAGNRSYTFYDAAGRVQYSVDATGTVTEYQYNKDNQVTSQTQYNKPAITTSWFNSTTGTVTKTTLTKGTTGTDILTDAGKDRTTQYQYDNAGRLVARTDAGGNTAYTAYDGASEITQVQTGTRVTRYYYDHDGRQVGVLDALGYLTENKFDAAGRLVKTTRYYTRSSAVALTPPTWSGVTNQSPIVGLPFSYHVPSAFDPNGFALSYSVYGVLPAWLSFDPSTQMLTGTPTALGPVTITLRATNSEGSQVDTAITLTVTDNAPAWQTLANQTMAVNTAVNITLPVAVDPDGHGVTYSLTGLPGGLSFDPASRQITGTLTTAGSFTVTGKATDTYGVATTQTFTFTVTNAAPTWTTLSNWTQAVNSSVNITLPVATDPEGQALTYTISTPPPGVSFNSTTRQLSGVLTTPGS
jgi:YD repeat-containing protein